MNQFLIETGILLLAAFFLGACLGCFLKSLTFGRARDVSEDVGVAAAGVAAAAAATSAVTAAVEEAEEDGDVVSVAHGYRDVVRDDALVDGLYSKWATADYYKGGASVVGGAAAIASAAATVANSVQETVVSEAPSVEPVVSSETVAPEAETVVSSAAIAPVGARELIPAEFFGDDYVPPVVVESDDFSKIKGLDGVGVAALKGIGVTKYDQLAAMVPDDVVRARSALGASDASSNISRLQSENWIEQAKILASGGDTLFSSGRNVDAFDFRPHQKLLFGDISGGGNGGPGGGGGFGRRSAPELIPSEYLRERGMEAAASGGVTASVMAEDPVVPQQSEPSLDVAPNVGAAGAALGAGVMSVALASSFQREDDESISGDDFDALSGSARYVGLFSVPRRPGRTRRIHSSGNGAFFDYEYDDQEPVPQIFRRPVRNRKLKRTPEDFMDRDDLKKLPSVGVRLEKQLNSIGIHYYEQVAGMTHDDILSVCDSLDLDGSVNGEDWVRQAQRLIEPRFAS